MGPRASFVFPVVAVMRDLDGAKIQFWDLKSSGSPQSRSIFRQNLLDDCEETQQVAGLLSP